MKLSELLCENASGYDNLSSSAKEMLAYLIHDKSHVFDKISTNKDMVEVLSKHSEKCNKTLYRGVSPAELKQIKAGKPLSYHTSYSESKEIAEGFGTVITVLPPTTGFCYWKYQKKTLEALRKNDPEEFDSVDGEHDLKLSLDEKEWIFDIGVVFTETAELTYKFGAAEQTKKADVAAASDALKIEDIKVGDRVSFLSDTTYGTGEKSRQAGKVVSITRAGEPIPAVPGYDFSINNKDSQPGKPTKFDLLFVKAEHVNLAGKISYVPMLSSQIVKSAKFSWE